MKFEVTNPKAWKAVNEKDMPMSHKIKVYEKLGGAYRLGEDGGEQVFNKMTELLKHRIQEDSENTDYEVSMSQKQLDAIIKAATELKGKMGEKEFNVEAWIQDHISQALNFINQANTGFDAEDVNELNEGVSSKEMDSIKQAVEAASSFMNVGSELKKLGIRYTFATEPLAIYIVQPTPNNKVAIINKRYASNPDFVVGDIAVGVMD